MYISTFLFKKLPAYASVIHIISLYQCKNSNLISKFRIYFQFFQTHAQHVLKGLGSVHILVPDAFAQCTHQFLTCVLSTCISSWRARSACVWVPDPYAQCVQKGWSMRVRNSVFSIIFKVSITAKNLKNHFWPVLWNRNRNRRNRNFLTSETGTVTC
jgi:hypothetical protein